MLIRHTKARSTGGVETVGECHIKTSFSFVYKQVYLIFHYSCIQAQNEICLVGKIYCVCVCFLHSDNFSHVKFDYRLRSIESR